MEIKVKDLAALVNGDVEGDSEIMVHDFAKIEEAGPGCVTFLANSKYTHFIYSTRASAVLVSRDFEATEPLRTTLIRVDDPYATLAELMRQIESMRPQPKGVEQPCFIAEGVEVPADAYIGAFAYIGRGVRLGRNVKIYPQVYLGDGAEVGDDTVLYAGVRVYHDCVIGKRCMIHSGAVIGADGFGFAPTQQGYEKLPQTGNAVIADDVEIGANTTVDRATFGSTRVGRGTKLDNLIQVAHNVQIGEHNVFAAQTGVAGSTHIGSWNRVGGQVGFAGHITVGDDNEIGAQSGIPNKVGSHKRIIGYPAIDARQFAKIQVYLRNLESLFKNKQ